MPVYLLTRLSSNQARPLSAEAFFNLFKTEAAKQAAKEEAEREKEAIKVRDFSGRTERPVQRG